MISKKQKNRKLKTKAVKKKTLRVRKVGFQRKFWSDRVFLNNGLFFWGLSASLMIVLFLGMISLFAAPSPVDVTVNILPPPPVITISASPNPVPNISTQSTITWSVTNSSVGGCSASGGWSGVKAASGMEFVGPISVVTTYTLTCSGPGGGPVSNSVTISLPTSVYSPSSPSISSFVATPTSVVTGGSATLSWSSSDTSSCSSTDFAVGQTLNASGSFVLNNITSSKSYTLTCTDGATTVTSSPIQINIVTVSLNANKTLAGAGETVRLTWSTNASTCSASGSTGILDWSGSKSPSLAGSQDVIFPGILVDYTYTLTCDGVSSLVVVKSSGLPPEITNFNSDKANVKPSDTATLNWQVTGADSCEASTIAPFFTADWTGILLNLSGNKVITLPNADGNYGYRLTCTNTFGTISRNVIINVSTSGTGNEPNKIVNPIPIEKPNSETFGGTGGAGGVEVTITTNNSEIEADSEGLIRVSWISKGADKCTASGVNGWSGDKVTSGSESIANPGVEGVYTYVLTCENSAGQKTIAYFKITVTAPQKIEGVVNIVETEVSPTVPNGTNEPVVQQDITAPVSDILGKTGVVAVFAVNKDKSPWQNALTVVMALSLLGLIGKGIYGSYWARKNRSFVFNSQNGSPITNAKIEIRRSSDNQIIQTILTDYKGRFRFRMKDLKDGNYRVNVEKRDFNFPSKLLSAKGEAGQNIYSGNSFKLIKGNGLRLKIPLDPMLIK